MADDRVLNSTGRFPVHPFFYALVLLPLVSVLSYAPSAVAGGPSRYAEAGAVPDAAPTVLPKRMAPEAPSRDRPNNTPTQPTTDEAYLIGPLDTIRVTVRGHPDLSTTAVVRPDGRISIPLVEDQVAANRTPAELARELENRLAVFVLDPSVTIEVVTSVGVFEQQVRVIGDVAQPRAVPYRFGLTLLDVITAVGGLSPFAASNDVVVLRPKGGEYQQIPVRLGDLVRRGDTTANIPMSPGDIVLVPEGVLAGQWTWDRALTLSTTFTDNVDLEPDGQKDPAIIHSVTPSVRVRGQTSRIAAALDVAPTFSYQMLSDAGPQVDLNLRGTSNTEVVRDLAFVDAAAAVTQEALDREESSTASGAGGGNLDTVQTYLVSPYLLYNLGSFAIAETRYSFGAVEASGDEVSDAMIHTIALGLRSGRDFSRFLWTARGGASRAFVQDDSNIDRYGLEFGPEYVITGDFSLLGAVGYERLKSNDTDLGGPVIAGGFRWVPNPDVTLRASYGRRLENPAADALLRYSVGPQTTLVATYFEGVTFGQERLVQDLAALSVDPTTQEFVDKRTGLDSPWRRPITTDIDDDITKTRQARVSLSTIQGRNIFSVGGYAARENDLDDDSGENDTEDEKVWGVTAGWQRQLDLRTAFTVFATYENGETQDNDEGDASKDDTYLVEAALSRILYQEVRGFVAYRYQIRNSTDRDDEYTENAVAIGITLPF